MGTVYLKVFATTALCQVPIETLISLFTIKYCNSSVRIMLVKDSNSSGENSFLVNVSIFECEFIEYSEMSEIASGCELPNLEESDSNCIAGLCATLRGFKESCLLACSEASVWTRFCEIDIISMLRTIVQDSILPVALVRFEHHMTQPMRVHNIYKYTMSKKIAGNVVTQNRADLPEHTFAEGMILSLADIIVFVCIHMLFNFIDKKQVHELIPLTLKWYNNLLTKEHILRSLNVFCIEELTSRNVICNYSLPVVENQSLYKSDPKRYKPRNRIYTRQEDIDSSLDKVKSIELKVMLDKPFVDEEDFDWDSVPQDATPVKDLPSNRLQRKFQQLESLCKPILKLAKTGDTIVDFCSGGGHLGILLAYLLPKCNLILLENKAESMNRAKTRVARLSLRNVKFYQSNLDYFKGHFDIGTCLHACGVATDLVLQQCIDKNAAFVCCPCCYGSVQDCHRIVYPRSRVLTEVLDKRSYLVLGHAADQTHDVENVKTKQGYECMTIIDTDRKMQAAEHGYQVYLNKLTPDSCSPKNHLLIGLPTVMKSS
ncbi:glutathione S-transferase C-terminal domain-containing protein homolog isoform X2 [Phymastichus coffea]|uniref:glutathione S-transferase C-terminal domain-containing protein homolog isoform X2 n=1 Tax=Phymastichus coffea TaxID=108790 RepID=UPI00273C8711|nr:glutathione S-transferase C-terminal domain-containing protein homolog isoform X2 [Phymastichus coffea]